MEEHKHSFIIEAPIDERGPQQLRIVPSFNQFLVYRSDDEVMLSCIQLTEDGEWEQIEGAFSDGVVSVIGKAISRANKI